MVLLLPLSAAGWWWGHGGCACGGGCWCLVAGAGAGAWWRWLLHTEHFCYRASTSSRGRGCMPAVRTKNAVTLCGIWPEFCSYLSWIRHNFPGGLKDGIGISNTTAQQHDRYQAASQQVGQVWVPEECCLCTMPERAVKASRIF